MAHTSSPNHNERSQVVHPETEKQAASKAAMRILFVMVSFPEVMKLHFTRLRAGFPQACMGSGYAVNGHKKARIMRAFRPSNLLSSISEAPYG
ncbi:MAG: hypothetical protein CMK83_13845 [Pseudomonadales bacterium]|nr:hypothetical protein [Pseudomonadales bacterium]RLT96278.1 MAG: hypothetical protein D9N15_12570 [Ketobacter sp.]